MIKNFIKNIIYKNHIKFNLTNKFTKDKSVLLKKVTIIIKGKNNTISIEKNCILKNINWIIEGDNNEIRIGKDSILNNTLQIDGTSNKVYLADRVELDQNTKIHIKNNQSIIEIYSDAKLKNTSLLLENDDEKIVLGKNTVSYGVSFAVTENGSKIEIGENCLFADQITIRTGDSHSIYDNTTRKRINFAKNVLIEDNVWIGQRVLILKGSHIEKNSVVGSGSVIIGKVPCNTVVGGNPAKILRRNIFWGVER